MDNQPQDEYELHRLCREGKPDEISGFLKTYGNAKRDVHDKKGFSPIHYAVKRDTADIEQVLNLLVSHQVDVNTRSLRDGNTALHMVVERFDAGDATTLALKLLSMGADPDYRNDKYRTPYDIAMAKNMLDLADYLAADLTPDIAAKELETYQKKNYGLKLITSIMEGNTDDIDSCLQQGANPNEMNQHGAAAIHYTVTHCSLDKLQIMQKLVDNGADVNLQDYEGDTALNLVIKTQSLRNDDVMYALVGKLLEWGTDYSLQDIDGKNALMLAESKSYDDIVALIKNHRISSSVNEEEPGY